MSVLADYFAAASDDVAATAAEYAAHPFARLEEFLTGRPYDDVVADPRHDALVAPSAEEIDGCIVLSMTDTLRDALASLDASALPVREASRRPVNPAVSGA